MSGVSGMGRLVASGAAAGGALGRVCGGGGSGESRVACGLGEERRFVGGERERRAEELRGRLLRRLGQPAFEEADRVRADARALGQLRLREMVAGGDSV